MRTNIIGVILTLAAIAAVEIVSVTTSSVTFAGGQNPSGAKALAGTSWKLVDCNRGGATASSCRSEGPAFNSPTRQGGDPVVLNPGRPEGPAQLVAHLRRFPLSFDC